MVEKDVNMCMYESFRDHVYVKRECMIRGKGFIYSNEITHEF